MTFLFPLGLLGLLALPLIVILHLIRQRRTRVIVPTTALWQAIRLPPEQKQHKLPLTPLLLMHLLIAACLALALASPALTLGSRPPTHTIIMLDTTSSMSATDAKPTRFAQAQNAALDLLDAMQTNDTVSLIELNTRSRLVATGGLDQREQLRQAVRDLAPAGNQANLNESMNIARSLLVQDQVNRLVGLSDKSLINDQAFEIAAEIDWRTFGGEGDNVAVVDFAAQRLSNGEIALYGRMTNFSPNPAVRTMQLIVDDEIQDEQNLVIAPNLSEERVWRVEAGARAALVLNQADIMPADDRADLPLEQGKSLRIRLVTANDTALERVLGALPQSDVTVTQQVNPNASPVDVTVLNGILPQNLPSGALLIVNPPNDPRLPISNSKLGERASSAALDPAFANVDMSSVQWGGRRPLAGEVPAGLQAVLNTEDAAPLVLRGTFNEQPAVIWLFDVDASNLPAKLAFPILTAASLNVLTTGALPPTLPAGAEPPLLDLQRPDGTNQPADQRLDQAGLYTFETTNGQRGGVAVQFGDPAESNLAQQPLPSFNETPQSPTFTTQTRVGWRLWWVFVVLALLILAAEWWYVFGRTKNIEQRVT